MEKKEQVLQEQIPQERIPQERIPQDQIPQERILQEQKGPPEQPRRIAFTLRVIHNQIKHIIHNTSPRFETGPKSQLQGGILGYLYRHRDGPVYQKDLEKEFRISRATATNTLQVMERDGLIVRKAQDKDARLKRIQMTEQAYQNHKQIEEHMDMMERCMQKNMTEDDIKQLHRLLGMLQRNLEEYAGELNAFDAAIDDRHNENCRENI